MFVNYPNRRRIYSSLARELWGWKPHVTIRPPESEAQRLIRESRGWWVKTSDNDE